MLIAVRSLLCVVASAGLAAIFSVATTPIASAETCGYLDPISFEYVVCAGINGDGEGQGPTNSSDQPCFAVAIGQPKPDDPVWMQYIPAGADPADYVLMQTGCGATDWQAPDIFAVLKNTDPPPDPYSLAQEAIAKLPIPLPRIAFGPNAEQVAVNVPVWLWVSNPDPVSASATDRTVTVTATATLASVTWSMGEPDAVDVSCTGGGQAPWSGADLWAPPCGYTYRLRSLDERTNGTGAWPVTAAATWAITWSANTGEAGTDSVTTRSVAPVRVGEWRTVIVAGN